MSRPADEGVVPDPICGWCFDGLCEDHDRDCSFGGLIPCACPNRKDVP